MMKKTLTAVAASVAILVAGSVSAGTVYLPLAMNKTVEGKQYRTIIWATNTTNEPVKVDLRFIPSMTDGTLGFDDPPDETVTVPPRLSQPLTAAYDQLGMLEVRSEGDLHYVGELHSFSPGGQRLSSTSIPVVDASNLLSAGATAHLLALERQPEGSESNLGIINLGGDEAACKIKAYRPDGSQILGTAIVSVPALGHREFPDAFGILGEPSIDGARFAVSCDQPFYAYGILLSWIPDSTQFVAPARGGDSALTDPAKSGKLINLPGNFFTSTQSNGELRIALPIDAGVQYDSMTIDFDMFLSRLPTDFFTATVQLRRNSKGGLFFAHTIRGGGRQKSILDMGVGDGLVHQGNNGTWAERSQYHLRFEYDTVAGFIDLLVTRGNQQVEHMRGAIGRFDLMHSGEGIELIFGLPKAYDNAYFPPWGSRFSNLVLSGVASVQ